MSNTLTTIRTTTVGYNTYTFDEVAHQWTLRDGCLPTPSHDLITELMQRVWELENG